jgi:hypothetical protein
MADSLRGAGDSRQNRHRILVIVSLFGAFAAVAVSLGLGRAVSWFQAEDQPARAAVPRARPAGRSQVAELMAAAPADLPVVVRGQYRLGPDRRLLLAVAEIQRLRTGAAPAPVKAEFQDGRWRILSGGDEVGTLSEFPAFEEGTDLLARWAGRLPQASPAAVRSGAVDTSGLERAARDIDAAALLKSLSSLGGAPSDVLGDVAKVRSLASSLAWLSTMTVDKLDQADPLLAEAWAWLALERSRDAGGETLAARALGYEAAAARASAKLAADDPVRLYATGDEARLGAVCAGRPADRPCHFLHLALLAERKEDERFRAAIPASPFRGETSLATGGLAIRLSEYEAGVGAGHDLAAEAVKSLSGGDEGSLEARTRDFEAAVDRLASGRGAGPVDTAAVQAAYRAVFYSGLYQEARFAIHQLASGPAARDFAARIKTPAAGTAEELKRWIEVKGQVLDGSREMRPLAELVESARAIGAAPLFDLGVTIARRSESTEPLRRRPIPALFERLDTRPSHRVMAAQLAERNLISPGLFEQLARAAAEAAPHLSEELPASVAEMREDTARLREIANDPATPRYTQTVALAALGALGKVDDAFIRARYQAMAAESYEGLAALLSFLEKRNDLRGALAAVEAAIQRDDQGGLYLAHLQTEKARLRLALGDPEGAFSTIEPALATYKEEALLQGAKIELARHHPENALALAQGAIQRYPEAASETSGLIARARWRLNDFSTAAKELAASRNGIVGAWNRYLPEAFVDTFAEAPEETARRAFSELQAAGIAPHVLADVAVALGKKRGTQIALPLLEGLHDPAPEWRDYIRLNTYDLIREKSGEAAALAWMHGVMPHPPKAFSMALYQMRKYDLLLGLYPDGQESEDPRLVRLLKAASLLHLRETSGPRWEGLVAEIEKEPSKDIFAQAARYLVGRADATAVLQPLPGPGHLTTLGWVMGIKAASERRFADADGWFQVALESGQQNQPPHAWSWGIESDWRKTDRSLSVLEKKGEF